MKSFILSALLLAAPAAMAGELRLLELDRFSMDHAKIANNRDAYFPYGDPVRDQSSEYWDYRIGTEFDLTIARYRQLGFVWANRIEGGSTNIQFRSVDWSFRWGVQLGRNIEIFYDHESEHILDASPDAPRTYKLKNAYGIDVTFYRRGN